MDKRKGRRKRKSPSKKKCRLDKVRKLLRDKEVRGLIIEIIRTIIKNMKG